MGHNACGAYIGELVSNHAGTIGISTKVVGRHGLKVL